MALDRTEGWSAVVGRIPRGPGQPEVVYRLAGDSYLLVEYGEMVLDLALRFRVEALERAMKGAGINGVLETAPGVRSLLIRYDQMELPLERLLEALRAIEVTLPPAEEMEVPSRLVYLPIAYRDRWTREAVKKYMASVRAEAPYLPDNMEFVAKCNGLAGPDEVVTYHTATLHMVLGLGDVYLGAPCAVPLDPRYRLVVPKYNPARLWTPEGAVGIGGAFVCIYSMESPGGYQLVGRTLPMWSTRQTCSAFREAPWLLRVFDRIQFLPVSEEELMELREAVAAGEYSPRIENGVFRMREYMKFLALVQAEALEFRKRQAEAAVRWTVGY